MKSSHFTYVTLFPVLLKCISVYILDGLASLAGQWHVNILMAATKLTIQGKYFKKHHGKS